MLSIILPNRNEKGIGDMVRCCIRYFPTAQIIVSDDPDSRGKGWAIRNGLDKAHNRYIVLIDGDFDIHPRMINRLLPFLEDYDIVVGTKPLTGSLSRKILTFLSRIYIRILFGLKIDTQTGIKVFRRETLTSWKTDGYAYDIEILAKAHRRGFDMIEIPIEASITRKMSAKNILQTLIDSLKIKWNLR